MSLNNNEEIKPCDNYCCQNILYFVTKDITEEGLVTVRHGNDCPILCGTKTSKTRAIIRNSYNDDKLCWHCKGEKLNYDKICEAWCCKHYEFVVDFTGGLIHSLDCKAIENMPIYDAMFKLKNYDLIDGYKKMGYSGLHSCLYCFARLN